MKKIWTMFFMLGVAWTGFAQDIQSTNADTFQGLIGIYGSQMEGKKTANGEIYAGRRYTAAHATLPFGTKLRVTNFSNGKTVTLTVNDRMPSGQGRILKISSSAAKDLGFAKEGVAYAQIDVIGRSNNSSSYVENDKRVQTPTVEAQMTDDNMSARINSNANKTEDSLVMDNDEDSFSSMEGSGAERDTTPIRQAAPEQSDVVAPSGKSMHVNRIFVIQFGAFSTQEKAVQYQRELSAKYGIATYYAKEGKVGSELYKVRESKIYRDLQEVFSRVLDYKNKGLDCFAVGKFFVANENNA